MYREFITIIIAAILLMGIAAASLDYYMEQQGRDLYEDDSPIEELIEDLVEDQLHFNIDLTPDSPEKV